MTSTLQRRTVRVLSTARLSETGYELVLERAGLEFLPGQELLLHGDSPSDDRAYSIASGVAETGLRILFRLIPSGHMTPRLARLKPGDAVSFTGPFGSFTLRDARRPLLFVATGTGIAPCRAFVRSCPGLRLTVLHGVRTEDDLFYRDDFAGADYQPCISRAATRFFHGRVTGRLAGLPLDPANHVYLCGANDMITDARRILKDRGVADDAIFAEPYYFW